MLQRCSSSWVQLRSHQQQQVHQYWQRTPHLLCLAQKQCQAGLRWQTEQPLLCPMMERYHSYLLKWLPLH